MSEHCAQDIELAHASLPKSLSGTPAVLGNKVVLLGRACWKWLREWLATVVVFALLGGLAYWGHHTGWQWPEVLDSNRSATSTNDNWCAAHDCPSSVCVECRPDEYPQPDYGWCRTHGVHNCVLEHPDLAQLPEPPAVTFDDRQRIERALALRQRTENNSRCELYRRRVQFASAQAMQKAGVDVAVAQQQPVIEFIEVNGQVEYDQTRVTQLGSPVNGRVWRVEKSEGEPVHRGDLLALIDAAEVGKAKSDLIRALAMLEQKKKLYENTLALVREGVYQSGAAKQIEAQAALRQAEVDLLSAEQTLLNLGFAVRADELYGLPIESLAKQMRLLGLPATFIEQFGSEVATANLYPLLAPHDGIVVQRRAVPGEVIDSLTTLFVIADVSQLWLTLHVPQEQLPLVRPGQPVRFTVADQTRSIFGKVLWISAAADPKTRTVPVRAVLANPEGKLSAGLFGTGQIVLRHEEKALVVPKEAVHWDGSCYVVFVRNKDFFQPQAPKWFQTRTVRLGAQSSDWTEIIVGLFPGEVVASKGSDVLRAALLKNNLGVGCTECHY